MSYSEDQQQEDKTVDKGLALGIDFGNSQISAAVWRPEKRAPDMLKFGNKSSFPATLYFSDLAEKHNLEARQNEGEANESKIEENPSDITPKVGEEFTNDKNIDYFVYDVKKYMGKNIDLEKIKGEVCYNVTMDENGNFLCFDEKIPFEKMAKFFIEKVVNTAKEQFQKDVNCCTISVPHGFNNDQRTAVINAANEAGIKDVYIINDPLSTGIYYISKNKLLNSEYFLVIDFGSSKLDITLLNISKHNSIRVKLSGGSSECGGNIFDCELLKEVKETYKSEGGQIPNDPIKMQLLNKKVEEAKIKLTFQNEAIIEEKKLDNKKELKYTIKRERFDELNKDNYNKVDAMYRVVHKKMTSSHNYSREALFMLYMLNPKVSRLRYEDTARGNGTMTFIEKFLLLGRYGEKDLAFNPQMNIISGKSILTCDGIMKPYISPYTGLKVMSLNRCQSPAELPDPGYVDSYSEFFPGTILECKIYLSKENVEASN